MRFLFSAWRAAAPLLLFIMFVPVLSGCGCADESTPGNGGAQAAGDSSGTATDIALKAHPCGQVYTTQSPEYSSQSGDPTLSNLKTVRIAGAFAKNSTEFIIIKDAQGNNVEHGEFKVGDTDTNSIELDFNGNLDSGTYTANVINSTP